MSQPPVPDMAWWEYEDVTRAAERTGIKYPVLLDPRIRSLLDKQVDPEEFEEANRQEPLAIYALIGLRFLLDRFESMTRFRFSVGPGMNGEASKIPVIATFHHDNDRGYFVALSLDIHGIGLDA